MAMLMSKSQSKHYSLLLQDDNDPGEHILSIHHDKIAESEEENNYEEEDGQEEDEDDDEDDDDDGFKSMIGEDEEQDVDEDEEEEDDDNEVGSDEEIFNSNQHRILANDNFRHAGSSSFGRKNDYHLLSSNEMNRKSNGLGIEPTLNAIWTPTPMSPVRRAFFLASIMFGVLVVAMFLWSIPCDVQPCGSEIKLKPRQWFTEVDYIGLNYSTLLEKINGDLTIFISFYKLDKITDTILKDKNEGSVEEPKYNISPSGCGLLSVEEKTGNLNWRVELEECPAHIKCDVMDATGDGLPDCIILGHNSMALMFEPIYGSIFWHIHIHNKDEGHLSTFSTRDYHYHLPVCLQDIDSDGFPELLFPVVELPTALFTERKKKHLILVSGRTGAVIGKPFSISNCFKIIKVFTEDVSIGYTCSMENRSELTGKIPLSTLLNEMGKEFDDDLLRNNTLEIENSREFPEVNDAVCQIRYSNEGKCPYCKTRVEFGFSSDNPLNQFFESASIVSWRILSYKGVCKGALMKLWKWDVNSLQKSFQENIPTSTTQLNDEKLATKEPGKVDFDIVSKDENFVNLFDDKDELDTLFPDGNKFSYNDDYDHKNNPLNPTVDDNSGSFKTMDSSEGASLKIHNRHNRNLPIFSTSHKTKRFYEHPIIHKHNGQQVSSNHGSLKMESSFSNLTKNFTGFSSDENSTTSFSRLLPPAGYQLQKLQEVLVLFSFNGSDWATHELGSMIVYQLCQDDCIPSHQSQKESVLVDKESLKFDLWSMYISSSSFSSIREDRNNETQITWSFESYIRRLLKTF